ncbi:MAG: hypothetical protein NW241_15315 [Bacteroidia bacterium]|nr:hypothetical protein [Bacteroidia bacterium]
MKSNSPLVSLQHPAALRPGLLLVFAGLFALLPPGAAAQTMRLSYFGETLTRYGLRTGLEHTLAAAESRSPAGRLRTHACIFATTLTLFRHPHNHLGLILAPEIGWRYTGGRGLILQAALTQGLFRSFYEGKTYEPGPGGALRRVPLAGQWGYLPGCSAGFGQDLSRTGPSPLKWTVHAHYMAQMPYSTTFQHRFAIEFGIIHPLNP